MILLLNILIFGTLIFLIWRDCGYDDAGFAISLTLAFAIIGVALFSLSAFVVSVGCVDYTNIGKVEKQNIYSLRNNQKVEGYFSLGSGKIGQEEHYFYYTKNSVGGFQQQNWNANRATIYEIAGIEKEQPYVQIDRSIPSLSNVGKFWAWPFSTPSGCSKHSRDHLELFVPQGTVIQRFEAK